MYRTPEQSFDPCSRVRRAEQRAFSACVQCVCGEGDRTSRSEVRHTVHHGRSPGKDQDGRAAIASRIFLPKPLIDSKEAAGSLHGAWLLENQEPSCWLLEWEFKRNGCKRSHIGWQFSCNQWSGYPCTRDVARGCCSLASSSNVQGALLSLEQQQRAGGTAREQGTWDFCPNKIETRSFRSACPRQSMTMAST